MSIDSAGSSSMCTVPAGSRIRWRATPCGRETATSASWDGPIEGAVEHLRTHGVEVEEGPVPRSGARGDGTSVYFRDPDGSLLELISYDV